MRIGNIYIEQSDVASLRIEADEKIIDDIITEVRNDELIIKVKTGLFNFPFFKSRRMTPISYYITVKELNTVDLFGSGDIFIKDLKTDRLSIHLIGSGDMDINLQAQETIITISGAGDILLKGKTDQQRITINGSGDFMADDFFSNECIITINGPGDALVHASQILDIHIKGSGDVRYKGNPNVTQNIFGSGNIEKVD
jgi:hypothetical protein